jgi:hypothetical protein
MIGSALKRVLAALMPLAVAACAMGPMLARDVPQSRRNVGDSVPDFIVAGKTTRADVLIALGEPDGAAEGGEQFVYTSVRGRGGFFFFSVRGGFDFEKRTYRRLVILFDDAGTVKNSRLEVASCLGSDQYRESGPDVHSQCVDVAGRDLPPIDSGDASAAQELAHGRAFAPAAWIPGSRGFAGMSSGGWAVSVDGSLVVGESSVFFLPPEAGSRKGPLVKLSYAQIAEVYVDSFGLNRCLVIMRTTGTYETFSIGGFFVDREATEAAAALIETRRKQAAAAPP